jgi:hypothetical protein
MVTEWSRDTELECDSHRRNAPPLEYYDRVRESETRSLIASLEQHDTRMRDDLAAAYAHRILGDSTHAARVPGALAIAHRITASRATMSSSASRERIDARDDVRRAERERTRPLPRVEPRPGAAAKIMVPPECPTHLT